VNHLLKIDTSAQSFSEPFTENSTNHMLNILQNDDVNYIDKTFWMLWLHVDSATSNSTHSTSGSPMPVCH